MHLRRHSGLLHACLIAYHLPLVLSSYIRTSGPVRKRFDHNSLYSHWLSDPFPNYQQYESPLQKRPEGEESSGQPQAPAMLSHIDKKILEPKIVSECVTVSGNLGLYTVESSGAQSGACGVYIFAEPDQVVEIEFQEMDVTCGEGLVVFFDGWEMNGKIFPGRDDHDLTVKERNTELCRDKKDLWKGKKLVSSQNVGLVQYLIPNKGEKFSFTVSVAMHPEPCNVFFTHDMDEVLTVRLSNGLPGRPKNCSLTTLVSPAKFTIDSISVGETSPEYCQILDGCIPGMFEESLTIGGSPGLDSTEFQAKETICGCHQGTVVGKDLSVMCETSTVRLVSSGAYSNHAVVTVRTVGGERMKKFGDAIKPKRLWSQNHEIFCPKYLDMMN